VDISQQNTDANLSVAFTDLDSLMSKASEMVKLAESVSNKLASKSDSVDEQTERDFRNLLLEMGVAGAVTKETAGNSFTRELARQLGDFAFRLLERRKLPLLPLADVYCLYNRARGTNLVSPEDLFRAASLMSNLSMPVELCKLPSGLLIVQSRGQTDEIIMQTVKSLIVDELDCVDALAVSRKANMALPIAILYLEKSEEAGILCRDDSPSGVKYYLNLILSSPLTFSKE
jgi:ESCRT-II complex subunit VPS36